TAVAKYNKETTQTRIPNNDKGYLDRYFNTVLRPQLEPYCYAGQEPTRTKPKHFIQTYMLPIIRARPDFEGQSVFGYPDETYDDGTWVSPSTEAKILWIMTRAYNWYKNHYRNKDVKTTGDDGDDDDDDGGDEGSSKTARRTSGSSLKASSKRASQEELKGKKGKAQKTA
ncbi:hypothetical protein HK101_006705, partial [Irineochytrium annulatum]